MRSLIVNRNTIFTPWLFAILISLAIEVPFVLLLIRGPHSTEGGIGMLFFAPSYALLALLSPQRNPFTDLIVVQTFVTSIPIFWILTHRRRSIIATVLRICSFLILLFAGTGLLARHEHAQYERDYAFRGATDNAVVSCIEALNSSLTKYKTKYGQYPARLEALSGTDGPFDANHAGLLTRPMQMEEFFSFGYSPDKMVDGRPSGYEIYVDPKQGKWSELYHYFTDESGTIRFDTTHDASRKGLVVSQQLHPSFTVN